MKKMLFTLILLSLSATLSIASEAHSDSETKQDIARHRVMAAAHESAAKCLESGQKEDVCAAQLQAACKGVAIGKFCGMKHVH